MLIASTVPGSWLAMQAVHEVGHAAAAIITGGEVERVVLHPLTISRTDFVTNPNPLFVVWAGPVVGVAAPLLFLAIAVIAKFRCAFLLRFFAGFCCVANGAYIAFGSFDRVGDCGEMLRHGSEMWQLWMFGIITVPCGFLLWHNQGAQFGFGSAEGRVDRAAAYGALVVFIALLTIGFIINGK